MKAGTYKAVLTKGKDTFEKEFEVVYDERTGLSAKDRDLKYDTTMKLFHMTEELAFLVYEVDVYGKVGAFDTELVEEVFRAITFNAGLTAHIIMKRGKNKHHIIEAAFKSLAVALRRASTVNDRISVPSTKGVL